MFSLSMELNYPQYLQRSSDNIKVRGKFKRKTTLQCLKSTPKSCWKMIGRICAYELQKIHERETIPRRHDFGGIAPLQAATKVHAYITRFFKANRIKWCILQKSKSSLSGFGEVNKAAYSLSLSSPLELDLDKGLLGRINDRDERVSRCLYLRQAN
ncbi:hypothetical protein Dimus_019037 [Dionaea muscipula]